MKKLSLSSVKEFLTRDEMRAISGSDNPPITGLCECANGSVHRVFSCESCGVYCSGSWICSGGS